MRRKANKADIFYIENHNDLDSKTISKELDLSEKEVLKYLTKQQSPNKKVAKKEIKLGRSKLKLKHGNTVYQLTEDIDVNPVKTPNTPDQDEKAGIYRG